ncbi:MAG: hypothetical protein PHS44_05625 [Candidatus Dojkabacteria bacterium]|nr:hypothetical protein [Candidatus Dojkabacteria bacterium]
MVEFEGVNMPYVLRLGFTHLTGDLLKFAFDRAMVSKDQGFLDFERSFVGKVAVKVAFALERLVASIDQGQREALKKFYTFQAQFSGEVGVVASDFAFQEFRRYEREGTGVMLEDVHTRGCMVVVHRHYQDFELDLHPKYYYA